MELLKKVKGCLWSLELSNIVWMSAALLVTAILYVRESFFVQTDKQFTDYCFDWTDLSDGNFDGEVVFRKLDADGQLMSEDLQLPVAVVKEFITDLVRNEKINRLKDASDDEVLGIL